MSRAEEFLQIIRQNHRVVEVLRIAEQLALPDWYLTGGCLFETVWNVLSGHVPQHGILDYDLFYFDDTDLSWEAEDAVIRRLPVLAPREVYETKTARWAELWPQLNVLPWPSG